MSSDPVPGPVSDPVAPDRGPLELASPDEGRRPTAASSDDAVIVASGVTKRYLLGEREQYRALRDVLARGFRRPPPAAREELVALDGVSFSVSVGEVVGIIGRNGAGKSTLLKILSRITTPTSGEIRMRGRIGSLLEVGSGFHPELTGVENVYMNGAILGMSRTEIRTKLDEIVTFAEMGKFVTTPVKHYSIGMFMRLAFAVAAHLDSEILIVDEVLAVGDTRFQQKCLSKMGEVARSGRSVLFVSHNLDATLALCDRGLVLDRGRLTFDGSARDAVGRYRQMAGITTGSGDRLDLADAVREGTGEARFSAIAVRSVGGGGPGPEARPDEGAPAEDRAIRTGDRLELDLDIESSDDVPVASLGLTVGTEGGLLLLNLDSAGGSEAGPIKLAAGTNRLRIVIPRLHLAAGRYRLGLRLANPITTRIGSGAVDLLDPALILQVEPGLDGPATLAAPPGSRQERSSADVVHQGPGSLVEGSMIVEF